MHSYQKSSIFCSSKVMRFKPPCFVMLLLLLRVLQLCCPAAAAAAAAAALHRLVCVYGYDVFGGCVYSRF